MSAGVMLALFFTSQEVMSGDGKLTIATSLRGHVQSTANGSFRHGCKAHSHHKRQAKHKAVAKKQAG